MAAADAAGIGASKSIAAVMSASEMTALVRSITWGKWHAYQIPCDHHMLLALIESGDAFLRCRGEGLLFQSSSSQPGMTSLSKCYES